jgi:hypothetical protein
MFHFRCPRFDWLGVPAQFVRDHNAQLCKLSDQPVEKPLGRLSAPACLNDNSKHITVRIDCTPQPIFPTVD